MTDEMRVALVAVAMAAGLGIAEAWEVVDDVAASGAEGDARQLSMLVAERAADVVYPRDAVAL